MSIRTTSTWIASLFSLFFSIWMIFSLACADNTMTYTRSKDDPSIDKPAMSNALDKRDLEEIFKQNLDKLLQSRVMQEAAKANPPKVIAILPFKNDTTEHIGPQLQAILSDIETTLVNDGRLLVVSSERRNEILKELELQQGKAFDQSQAVRIGQQLGAHYVLTGKAFSVAERTDDMRRVQYFIFMQIIDVSTGVIRWQNKLDISKALVPLD